MKLKNRQWKLIREGLARVCMAQGKLGATTRLSLARSLQRVEDYTTGPLETARKGLLVEHGFKPDGSDVVGGTPAALALEAEYEEQMNLEYELVVGKVRADEIAGLPVPPVTLNWLAPILAGGLGEDKDGE